MSLDNLGDFADIIAVPLAIFGLILIIHQLKMTRHESQTEHNRRQNEMTFNAYNTVRSDLRETIQRIRKKLELEDMFDKFSEEHLRQITNDKELRDDVAKMLGFLNKFAVGIKYEVFNIGLVNDLSGKLFIETYRQFKPYIDWVRKDYETFYVDYENLVLELKKLRNYKD
jgi:hypothetical protein